MQLDILDITGQKTGKTIELPSEIFGIEPNNHVVYLAVKQYLASTRSGTHKVKTRAEVHGASRKLHKQKGTGGARKGNIRNPLYKGGGTIFGPKPHKYNLKVNRKVKDLAKVSALSYKAKENSIIIVENIQFETPKTSDFSRILTSLSLDTKKSLFVTPEYNDNLYLSTRNIPNATANILADLNTYDIVNADVLVFTESAIGLLVDDEVSEEI